MKKISGIIFTFLCISLISYKSFATIIKKEVSLKYSDIFNQKILSNKDIESYRKIIFFQDSCNWKLSNKYILNLENRILLGHILAQRYLHPKCYRSEFFELSSWLKKYNDHPQAKRIYRLAIKRMPKGYKRPLSPSNAIGIKSSDLKKKISKKYKSSLKLSKNQRIQRQKLLNQIKSRINKGWPTGAAKLLNQRDVKILLDQVEIDQQKEFIAKGYFLANQNDNSQINELAIKFADEALKNSPKHVPYAGWTAGLAAWKLKDYEKAANYFSNFSISLKDDEWHQSSGAFWAARSYSKLNQYSNVNFWLLRASKNPDSFYGMLSSYILGIENPIDWGKKDLENAIDLNFSSIPAIQRIKALIQLGLINELEREIIKINIGMNKEIAIWSLEIAEHLNLAHTQLKIAQKLGLYGVEIPIKYYYPTPLWEPKNGYYIDRALMYALMHQESMFNSKAKSRMGAVGLMQIMPATAKFISKNKEVKRGNSEILKTPSINIEVGQEYIKYLLDLKLINQNLIYLTAAYNGGPGNLEKWLDNKNYLDDALMFMESIPSRETRWFIEKVLTKYWIYKNKLNSDSKSLKMLAEGKNPIY